MKTYAKCKEEKSIFYNWRATHVKTRALPAGGCLCGGRQALAGPVPTLPGRSQALGWLGTGDFELIHLMACHPGILSAAPEAEGAFRPPQRCQASLQACSLLSSCHELSALACFLPERPVPWQASFLGPAEADCDPGPHFQRLKMHYFSQESITATSSIFFFLSKGELRVLQAAHTCHRLTMN